MIAGILAVVLVVWIIFISRDRPTDPKEADREQVERFARLRRWFGAEQRNQS